MIRREFCPIADARLHHGYEYTLTQLQTMRRWVTLDLRSLDNISYFWRLRLQRFHDLLPRRSLELFAFGPRRQGHRFTRNCQQWSSSRGYT